MQLEFGGLHAKLPPDTQVLSIHGKLDQVVPFSSGQEILRLIPHAQVVETGDRPGQIPDYQFGHHWWEYFDIQIWQDVIDRFLGEGYNKAGSRL
jgi:pimeloyl-ACP methyl ester carboxylesterase